MLFMPSTAEKAFLFLIAYLIFFLTYWRDSHIEQTREHEEPPMRESYHYVTKQIKLKIGPISSKFKERFNSKVELTYSYE